MGTAKWLVKSTLERFKEVKGTHLAGAITLAGFLSLLPLLLLAVAVLGFVAAGRVELDGEVAGRLGLGPDASTLVTDVIANARDNRGAISVASALALLWSGSRVVAANQFALNTAWGTEAARGARAKLVGLAWLAGVGGLFLASIGAGAVSAALLPPWLVSVGLVVSLALDVALWLWTFSMLVNNDEGWRAHLPGAVLGAVGTGVLKAVGSFYLPRSVASASALYGPIGVIFALLLWLLLFGRLVVLAASLNSVWAQARAAVSLAQPAPPASPPRPAPSASPGREPTRTAAPLAGG